MQTIFNAKTQRSEGAKKTQSQRENNASLFSEQMLVGPTSLSLGHSFATLPLGVFALNSYCIVAAKIVREQSATALSKEQWTPV
jgi:hypothetical protein